MSDDPAPLSERELLELALERSPAQRAAFLAEQCAADKPLRERVERLLAAHERAAGHTRERASLTDPIGADLSGTELGPYRLMEKLGEGGMGVVYLAQQAEPIRREVALKVIKLGMDTSEVVARFEAERQTLALMEHPSIARVFDAGATSDGRPYFVMERVRGQPITEHCDAARLSTEQRLELFSEVCAAVQHAHQKGIIHRDIKPSNVLVTEDERPLPKVIDFGIAKATRQAGDPLMTLDNQVLGTPEYMSPEQTGAAGADVDTRSDIYSLGVLLYELLTGTKPFDFDEVVREGLRAVLRHIAEVDPDRPSTRVGTDSNATHAIATARGTRPAALSRVLRGDLDWIVLKAMEKEPERRYESAAALAADVQRYLTHRPVEAGRPGALYRAAKFARRNRIGVIAAGAVLLALTSGAGALLWSLRRVSDERDQAQVARDQAQVARDEAQAARERAEDERDEAREVTSFLSGILKSASPLEQGREVQVRTLLRQAEGRLERELAQRPQVRAQLAHTLGKAYDALGDYERSHDLHAQAAELRRAKLGSADPQTLSAQVALATSVWRLGRFDESRELLHETLETAREALGPYDKVTLNAYGNLAIVTRAAGDREEAEALYEELIGLYRQHLGDDHPETLNLLRNRVGLLWVERRFEDAEALLAEIFEHTGETTVRDHPNYLSLLSIQTQVLEWRAQHAEAEALHREVLAARRRVLGPEHPDTIESLQSLASFLGERARFDEAAPLLAESVSLKRDILGPDHPQTLRALRESGMLLWRTDRLPEAQTAFEEIRAAYAQTLGEEHPRTLDATNMLAIVHYGQGHYEQAERYWRSQLEAIASEHGEAHKDTIIPRVNLGMVLTDLGRFGDAERYYRRGLELCLAQFGPANNWTLSTQNNLAVLLQRQGKFAAAAELNAQVIQQRERQIGPTHPDTLGTKANRASCLYELGLLDEARALLEAVLAASVEVLGSEHASTLRSQQTLGTVAWEQGASDEAEQIFRSNAEGLARALGEEHPDTLRTRHMLAVLARDRGRLDEARTMLEELTVVQASALGPDHTDHLQSLEVLAEIRHSAGDEAAAQELVSRVREARLSRLDDEQASWVDLAAAAELLLRTGRSEDASHALEIAKRLTDQQTEIDPQSQQLLARCHAAVGEVEVAQDIVADLLDLLEPNDPRRAALSELLAELATE